VLDGRKRAAVKITVGVLVTIITTALLGALPSATASPDLETVKQKVERLYHNAEIASERYNTASDRLTRSRTTLDALNADLHRQQSVVGKLRDQVATMVVDQYQGQALSSASQLALSDDPAAFLDNINAISSFNSQRGEVMEQYGVELSRLEQRQKAVEEESAALRKTEEKLAEDKARIDELAAAAQEQLDALEAEQREKLLAGDYSGSMPDVEASGRAAAAVRYAMAQVGKAYVYGAAGPSAYDCSGLTMRAWAAAGVGLPHSSSAQFGSGTRIPESQLRPGDLVFYYSPISHVGMYIGNGLIVNAENPSSGVRVTGLHSMPYVGAVRPG
jgi:cell wall-associated NlpC family hydrolase